MHIVGRNETRPGEVLNFSRAHVAIGLTVSIDGVALGETSDEADHGVVLDDYALLATVRSINRYAKYCLNRETVELDQRRADGFRERTSVLSRSSA
jgi:hypothetical protein